MHKFIFLSTQFSGLPLFELFFCFKGTKMHGMDAARVWEKLHFCTASVECFCHFGGCSFVSNSHALPTPPIARFGPPTAGWGIWGGVVGKDQFCPFHPPPVKILGRQKCSFSAKKSLVFGRGPHGFGFLDWVIKEAGVGSPLV